LVEPCMGNRRNLRESALISGEETYLTPFG
jgi:hypothetical protein